MEKHFDNRGSFVELYSLNYNRIKHTILTLVPNVNEAEDIMQETSRIMWEKFDQFEIGTNFVAWAVTIARYQILSYRAKYNSKVKLDPEIIELLVEDSKAPLPEDQHRIDALRKCLKKLELKDQSLIRSRFELNKTAKELSKENGVAMNTIYRNQSRILSLLMGCIRRSVGLGEI